jgi:hypothetical protein
MVAFNLVEKRTSKRSISQIYWLINSSSGVFMKDMCRLTRYIENILHNTVSTEHQIFPFRYSLRFLG